MRPLMLPSAVVSRGIRATSVAAFITTRVPSVSTAVSRSIGSDWRGAFGKGW